MKQFTMGRTFYVLAAGILFFTSCKKEESATGNTNDSSATIAVASYATSHDSVYLMQQCRRGERRDSVAESALPASVSAYLIANYAGYNFHRAFILKDQASATTGYVVVIFFNDKPVGLQFDASGNFVKVLEQRDKDDLSGPGFHRGGHFEHRDGMQRDSIALAALAAGIKTYFATNFASDTLEKAFVDGRGNIIVISRNNGLFATVFSSTGIFLTRTELAQRHGPCQAIEQAALPGAAVTYLNNTYPNYIFKRAFAIKDGTTIKGYVVFIDANNTKYAVEFDASGNFVRAKTVF